MEISKRLQSSFGADEPIFIDEIKTVMKEYSTPYIFRCIKEAIAAGNLVRYDDAIYYIPTTTILGKSVLNPYRVIEKKYMRDGGGVQGFYSGWTFLNGIGGTRQVPNVIEVVTNRETMRVREAMLGRQRLILRRPKTTITTENEKVLSVLEFATQFDIDEESKLAIVNYSKKNSIAIKDFLRYAEFYPAKTIKNMIEVLYELA